MNTRRSDTAHELIANLVWRCWRTLGVPAHAHPIQHTVIDPEALLVLTAWITREHESRMAAEVATWCRDNHGMLSHIRFRNLAGAGGPERIAEAERLVALANGHAPGKSTGLKFLGTPRLDAEPAVPIYIADPAMLRFRLRSLMGPGARAEALAVLLCQTDSAAGITTANLARETLFGQRHLREALNDLVYGGWVSRWKSGPRELRFAVTSRAVDAFGPIPNLNGWIDLAPTLVALTRASQALASKSIGGVATVITIVTDVEANLRQLSIQLPDWHGADTEDGMQRIDSWIGNTVHQLTRVT